VADRPKDESERDERKLRAVPDQPDVPEDFGSDAEEVVMLRRREKRLAAQQSKDYPWTRRILGFGIIAAAFFYGWKSLNHRTDEMVRQHDRENLIATKLPPSITATPSSVPKIDAKDSNAPTNIMIQEPLEKAKLDPKTMTTIAECTKGVDAFRLLDVGPRASASGESTLESVFSPVMLEQKSRARRSVALQNVRIRTKSGEEWRLHASPRTQGGQLFLKLFRVAQDGLPEAMPFPDEIKDLADARLSDEAVNRFLQFSETPGHAIEVERHEAWSYPDKAGLQLILSDNLIFDIQVFMRERFLACSRGAKAGVPSVTCQCVERGHGS
jgi:hypothetical protein